MPSWKVLVEVVRTFVMTADTTVTGGESGGRKHKVHVFPLGESPHCFLFHQQVGNTPPRFCPIQKGVIVVMGRRSKGHLPPWMCWAM